VTAEYATDHTAFPRYIKHPVENMADWEALKERLDPNTPGRFPANWAELVPQLNAREHVLVAGQTEIGFFGWHRDLMGVENLLFAYFEQPELIHAISRHKVEFTKAMYSRLMKDLKYDYVFFWEDMAFKNGPLISPAMFREFMLPYYKDLIGYFKSLRPDLKVILDSDGDITQLIPLFIEGGVDGLLPFECAAGMDIVKVAQQYPDLVIVGGIDKMEIAKGPAAIDAELEKKLPAMFKRGGYLPSLDHHVPPEVSFDNFRYYIEKTREIYRRCR
jgi:uroporphyrinogen-III decarboxylase